MLASDYKVTQMFSTPALSFSSSWRITSCSQARTFVIPPTYSGSALGVSYQLHLARTLPDEYLPGTKHLSWLLSTQRRSSSTTGSLWISELLTLSLKLSISGKLRASISTSSSSPQWSGTMLHQSACQPHASFPPHSWTRPWDTSLAVATHSQPRGSSPPLSSRWLWPQASKSILYFTGNQWKENSTGVMVSVLGTRTKRVTDSHIKGVALVNTGNKNMYIYRYVELFVKQISWKYSREE